VHPDTAVALSSPASTIEGLLRAAQASSREWGARTAVNLPALTVTVREMAAALERVAGPAAVALLDWEIDEGITAIVGNWPSRVQTARAQAIGLQADTSFEAVIRDYVRENPDAVKLSLQSGM
ncbi:MAG: NAD-dependent epimerase, partial [Polaromonas sp.]